MASPDRHFAAGALFTETAAPGTPQANDVWLYPKSDGRFYGKDDAGTEFPLASTNGSTNFWIPASAWIPRTTTGCGVDSRELATNKTNYDELLFDTAADEYAQALVILPNNYNNSTITARFYWTCSTAVSGGNDRVDWGIQGRAYANDDALDTAFGTAQTVSDTVIATNDMHITSATSAVTIGGTPAANTPILFQVYRDTTADNYGFDARLLGVEISYTAA